MSSGHPHARSVGSTRSRSGEPQPISDILPGVVARLAGLDGPPVGTTEVVRCWEEIAGRELAAHVRAGVAGARKVVLEADGPEWAALARFSATTLAERLGGSRPAGSAGGIDVVVRVRRPGTSLW